MTVKPWACPFCAAAPNVEPTHGYGGGGYSVACKNGLECWVIPAVSGPTESEAIRRWNRRYYYANDRADTEGEG